jgi:hypothetical protein
MRSIDAWAVREERNRLNTKFGPLEVTDVHFRRRKEISMDLIRKPKSGSGGTDYNPWLTPEVFGKSGKGTVNLLGTMRSGNSQFGEGIILDVKVTGSAHSWTVKYASPNYSRLHKRFGDSEKKWKGPVNVEVKEYMGKEYVAVV